MLRAVASGVAQAGTGVAGVSSFNLRTGAVTLNSSDISNAGGALLLNPVFTGDPRAPTPAPGDADTSIATTAFVQNAIGSISAGVTSFNTRTGAITLTSADVTGVGGALLASPVFTGDPQAPTPTAGDADNSIATTAFVQNAIVTATSTITGGAFVGDTAPASPAQGALWWDSVSGQLYVRYNDPNSNQWVISTSGGIADAPSDGALYGRSNAAWVQAAPIASPVFTGNAQAVTPPAGDNDTSVATTAFVQTAVAPTLNDTGRNLIHNPVFTVAQRGTGPWTTSGYTLDRWISSSNLDVISFSRTALSDADRSAIGDEAAIYCLQNVFTGNAGAAAYTVLGQMIENIRRLAGKTVTVSFWAKSASGAPKLGVNSYQYFGGGGGGSAAGWGTAATVTLSTAWTRYSVTLTIPSIIGKTLGSNGDDYTSLQLWYSSGTNLGANGGNIGVQSNTFSIWGVQLEIGSVATPLAKRDPADELAVCQRFYQANGYVRLDAYGLAGAGFSTSVAFPVVMRATPTVVLSNVSNVNVSSFAALFPSAQCFVASSTATATGGSSISANYTASADL